MLAERCDTKSQFSRYGYVLIRLFPQWKLKLNALLKQKNTLFSQRCRHKIIISQAIVLFPILEGGN